MKALKIILPIVAVLVAAGIGIAAFLFMGNAKDNNLDRYLDFGTKYLEVQDYDSAIAIFEEALAVDDKCTYAYAGLSAAYVGKGDVDKAVEVLKEGYEKTGDEQLKTLEEEIEALQSGSGEVMAESIIQEVIGMINERPTDESDRGSSEDGNGAASSDPQGLVKILLDADYVVLNGTTYNASSFYGMDTTSAGATLGVAYGGMENPSEQMYADEGMYSEDSSVVVLDNNVSIFESTTPEPGVSSVYFAYLSGAYNRPFVNISYNHSGCRIPYDSGANDAFEFFEANGLKDIDDIIEFVYGKDIGDDEKLVINAADGSMSVEPGESKELVIEDSANNVLIEVGSSEYSQIYIGVSR